MWKKLAVLVAASMLTASTVASATPAASGPGAVTLFDVGTHYTTDGSFTWYSRVTTVAGDVWMVDPVMTGEEKPVRITQVVFDAYQGATRVDSEARSTVFADAPKSFRFDIGDPNLPGGIDRIKITICGYYDSSERLWCNTPVNYQRPF
jgi:hypothetical protein